jgi:hypothetical protein
LEQVEFGAIERERVEKGRAISIKTTEERDRERERKKELKQQKEIDATTQCTRMYLGLSSFSYSSSFGLLCVYPPVKRSHSN